MRIEYYHASEYGNGAKVKFSKELMQMPMLQQQAQMNPQIQLQLQQMMQMIESRKAKLMHK